MTNNFAPGDYVWFELQDGNGGSYQVCGEIQGIKVKANGLSAYIILVDDDNGNSILVHDLTDNDLSPLGSQSNGNVFFNTDDFEDQEGDVNIPVFKLEESSCKHINKVKSYALGNSFWYCRDCKKEVNG